MAIVMICLLVSVKADIAECINDNHCDVQENECCARVIVEDSSGNYIDSHYCLQRPIIEELGNRYYFKGILGRAYCNWSSTVKVGLVGALALALVHLA